MYKQGYKHIIRDLEHAKKNMSKFKRGLSIFEDGNPAVRLENMLRNLLDRLLRPYYLSNGTLKDNLHHVLMCSLMRHFGYHATPI